MLIIQRYIGREILLTTAAVTAILLPIVLSNGLARYLQDAAEGKLAGEAIAVLVGLRVPGYLTLLLPLAFFLAILLAFGRLYRDSEMTVLSACGVGPRIIVGAIVGLACLLSLLVVPLAFYVTPWSGEQMYQVQEELESRHAYVALAPGRFESFRGGDQVVFVERMDAGRMQNVFIHEDRESGETLTLSSREGLLERRDDGWAAILLDGYRYEGTPGEADFRVVEFDRHTVNLPAPETARKTRRNEALPTLALWRQGGPDAMAELQWRASVPLSLFVLGLLAIPLSRVSPRQGRFARLALAIVLYLVYGNLLGLVQTWVEEGVVPVWLGLWWVHGLILGIATVLLIRQYRPSGWRAPQ